MVQTISQLRPRTTFSLTFLITLLCLSTIILHPAIGFPTPAHLLRRQELLSHNLVLPPLHRSFETRDLEAEAGVVIPPTISIREVEAEVVEENAKRGLPRGPGSGTYYPGQPYGRRDVDDASS
ncbi:MAG: hypothetical protein JOS17DRAFT_778410 [Linnemannia elongata]|nr:MAG: hypothetical protein JOS17DRAFT_778410 [Linnemannia elongata]